MYMSVGIFCVMTLLYLITQQSILRVPLEYNNSGLVQFNRVMTMQLLYIMCVRYGGGHLRCGLSGKSLFISSTAPGEGGGGKPSSKFSSLLP